VNATNTAEEIQDLLKQTKLSDATVSKTIVGHEIKVMKIKE
jgi:hypothetical protein